jgi:hypothetical protein
VAAGLGYSWKHAPWFGHLEGWIMQPLSIEDMGVDYRAYARGITSVGWLWQENLSLLAQLHAGTSAFDTGVSQLDDSPVQIAMGLNWKLKQGTMMNLSLVENVSQQTAPDFSFTVGLYFD